MGKRGPQPKSAESKTIKISASLTALTHAKIAEAAAANGRALSAEIEHRLVRTLVGEEEKWKTAFGSRQSFAIFRLASIINKDIEARTGGHWYSDQFTHAAVTAALVAMMERFRPAGDMQPPPSYPVTPELADWPEGAREKARQFWFDMTPSELGKRTAKNALSFLALAPIANGPLAHTSANSDIAADILRYMDRPAQNPEDGEEE